MKLLSLIILISIINSIENDNKEEEDEFCRIFKEEDEEQIETVSKERRTKLEQDLYTRINEEQSLIVNSSKCFNSEKSVLNVRKIEFKSVQQSTNEDDAIIAVVIEHNITMINEVNGTSTWSLKYGGLPFFSEYKNNKPLLRLQINHKKNESEYNINFIESDVKPEKVPSEQHVVLYLNLTESPNSDSSDHQVKELKFSVTSTNYSNQEPKGQLIFCLKYIEGFIDNGCKSYYTEGKIVCSCLEDDEGVQITTFLIMILLFMFFVLLFVRNIIKTIKKSRLTTELNADRFLYILCNQKIVSN